MVTKIVEISLNEIVISFDNRTSITVTSDNGCARHLVEHMLSPRSDMSYSQYLEVMAMSDETTDILEAA